jgi:hypothetical protein
MAPGSVRQVLVPYTWRAPVPGAVPAKLCSIRFWKILDARGRVTREWDGHRMCGSAAGLLVVKKVAQLLLQTTMENLGAPWPFLVPVVLEGIGLEIVFAGAPAGNGQRIDAPVRVLVNHCICIGPLVVGRSSSIWEM